MINLISPNNNEVICTISESCKRFYDDYKAQQKLIINDYKLNGVNWGLKKDINVLDYCSSNDGKFFERPISLKYKIDSKSKLFLSKNADFSDSVIKKIIYPEDEETLIYNLERNGTYYWQIIDLKSKEKSEIRCFKIDDYPRGIYIDGIYNVRDFGGYNTKHNKRIKQGLLYRGHELVTKTYFVEGKLENNQPGQTHIKNATQKTLNVIRKLLPNGIEIDFRSYNEANFINESVLSNEKYHVDYIEGGTTSYDFIFDEGQEFKQWYKKVFELIANADKKPVYVHCWGGADRTGTLCFLLGALLGMSYTDLVIEYELTSFCGNTRRHYDLNPPYDWLHYVQFIERLEQYAKENNISPLEYDAVVHHLLNKHFAVKEDTINKIKKTFLEN